MYRILLIILTIFTGCNKDQKPEPNIADFVMIGAGIMSSTLASLLYNLDPALKINIYERLNEAALESSEAWNNAGTGHAGYCELNYTPKMPDGSIDIKKAVDINEAFFLSKQFWAYQIEKGVIPNVKDFLVPIPHISLVWGDDNVSFLKKRFAALEKSPLFLGMEYSENFKTIKSWAPLTMEGRDKNEKVAATRFKNGTDVNFGRLAQLQIDHLKEKPNISINFNHEVSNIKRNPDNTWLITIKDLKKEVTKAINAKRVFIGAGGASLTLLQKSNIPESKGFAGFPVGGMWLVSNAPEVIDNHAAKVYGKASLGAPPMSVPHLDSRYIDGQEYVLFGPFATFSTKFLKTGSVFDLLFSINLDNFIPLIEVAYKNFDLIKYLVTQVLLTPEERMKSLREYYPLAQDKDWKLEMAGQRVQVIKKDPKLGGVLQFGTEIVSSSDGSITALLGASPGASVAVKAMLDVINISFKENMTQKWQAKIKNMIPSYGESLNKNTVLLEMIRKKTDQVLKLN